MSCRSVFIACALSLTLAAATALADGCFVGPTERDRSSTVSSAAQKAILVEEQADEVLLLQTTYRGPARRFAWVIPVPSAPREVFSAEPAFLDQVFQWTEPRVATWLDDPQQRGSRNLKSALARPASATAGPPGGGPEAQMPPPVQVLQRLEVGDYQAAVLASHDSTALQNWLRANRYAVPEGAQATFTDYLNRGWVFVAVKLLDKVAAGQPTITEVAPLGLRFARPREGLVYPLTISRVSSPPLCSLLLVTISDGAQTCVTLPVNRAHHRDGLRRGETLGDFRRALTRPRGKPALLCEYSAPRAINYDDLSYRQEDWARGTPASPVNGRFATRFFGLLAPNEMQDLYFRTDEDTRATDYHLLVQRRGRPLPEAWAQLNDASKQVLRAGRQIATVPGPRPPALASQSGGLLALVAALLLIGLIAAVLVGGKLKFWSALLPLALAALLLTPAGRGVLAGGDPNYSPLYATLNVVTQAASYFREDTGLWPATVADLAANGRPAQGRDASGNLLPLVSGWRGPYLSYCPADPLGGPGLVVDPLNNRLVDSGGFSVTISGATSAQARDAGASEPTGSGHFWQATPTSASEGRADYASWLRGRVAGGLRRGDLFEHWGGSGFAADYQGTLVGDTAGHELWLFDWQVTAVGEMGALVQSHLAASPTDAAGQPANPRSFIMATTAQGSRLLTPRLLPLAVKGLAASPDQRTLALCGAAPSAPGEFRTETACYALDAAGRLSRPLLRGHLERWLVPPAGQSAYVLRSHDNTCDLVRVPLNGAPTSTLKSGTDCDVLQTTSRGVLIGGANREFGVLDSAGGWHPVTLPPQGEPVAVQARGDEVALATLSDHSDGSYPQGRPDKKCLTVSLYLSSLTTGQCRLVGTFSVIDPPRRLALLPVSADRVDVFVTLNSTGEVYVEVAKSGVRAWKLAEQQATMSSRTSNLDGRQYCPASAPFTLNAPHAGPVPALDDLLKAMR